MYPPVVTEKLQEMTRLEEMGDLTGAVVKRMEIETILEKAWGTDASYTLQAHLALANAYRRANLYSFEKDVLDQYVQLRHLPPHVGAPSAPPLRSSSISPEMEWNQGNFAVTTRMLEGTRNIIIPATDERIVQGDAMLRWGRSLMEKGLWQESLHACQESFLLHERVLGKNHAALVDIVLIMCTCWEHLHDRSSFSSTQEMQARAAEGTVSDQQGGRHHNRPWKKSSQQSSPHKSTREYILQALGILHGMHPKNRVRELEILGYECQLSMALLHEWIDEKGGKEDLERLQHVERKMSSRMSVIAHNQECATVLHECRQMLLRYYVKSQRYKEALNMTRTFDQSAFTHSEGRAIETLRLWQQDSARIK
jgi:hypothetical protein